MLVIKLDPIEGEIFPVELRLEHSLLSLSKWESIHEKVFFSQEEKTEEESISYIKCMLLDEVSEAHFSRFTKEHVDAIHDYINGSHSATTFREEPGRKQTREVITSELVYYWLIQFQIPFSCETWNFSRLMNLIRICGIKQTKPKKMSRTELAAQQRRLNEERRAQLGTSG